MNKTTTLNFSSPPADPFAVLAGWIAEADKSEPHDALSASLASVDKTGLPNWRMVLVKSYPLSLTEQEQGFVFFTNTQSTKAEELQLSKAALGWHWKSLRRQIRVRGSVAPTKDVLAQEYFATRSRASQLAAWASAQSSPLASHKALQEKHAELDKKFADSPIPCPPFWGGYRVRAHSIEFWQDGAHRLHQRLRYQHSKDGWNAELLNP